MNFLPPRMKLSLTTLDILLFLCVYFKPVRILSRLDQVSGGDLAPSLGNGEIFRGPTFVLNDVFSAKNCIFMAKKSDDLFLVIQQIFPFFSAFSVSLLR